MRESPNNIHMITGTTGEKTSNAQMLRQAVPLSRALSARGASNTVVLYVMRNHQQLVSLTYAAMWAAATPCLLEPLSTTAELSHFLPLVKPSLVVCDADRLSEVRAAVKQYPTLTEADILTHDRLDEFSGGFHSDIDTFKPVPVAPDAVAVLLPTSGSTGLSKAAEITHDALLAQLPSLWSYHKQFPRPTERAMLMSTAQWMTFSNMLTTSPVYQITLVLTTDKTIPTILRIIQTQQPTWLLLVPGTAAAVADAASGDMLTSLQDMVVTGAAPSPATMARLKELAPGAIVHNSYGMTEAQGFAAVADPATPFLSIGKIFNIFQYKLVNEDGETVPQGERGELYLKSDCIIKRYVNNEEAYKECCAPDGWWKTGDVFHEDANNYFFFGERKKFWFKYLNYHISPEELEKVISSVPGVLDVAVAGSDKGAAAAVVAAPGAVLTREVIHHAVDSALIEYKRLRGGVAFVTSLPRTHSGKLHRANCRTLIQTLVENGQCF